MKILTLEQVSELMHKELCSLRSDRVRNPDALPPSFKFPGCRRLVFLESEVHSWIIQEKDSFQHKDTLQNKDHNLSSILKSNRSCANKIKNKTPVRKGRPLNSSKKDK